MREVVYTLLILASANPAAGSERPTTASAAGAQRLEAPAVPRLEAAVFHPAPALTTAPNASPPRADCAGVCAPTTPAPPRAVLGEPWQPTLPRSTEAGRATLLAWSSAATGLSAFAGGVFGEANLIGHAAWPLGATVPAAKVSAGVALGGHRVAGSRVQVGLSIDRNWQLDGPIGGTYPDCAVRLDVAVEALPKISARAPCGSVGHFGLSIHGRF